MTDTVLAFTAIGALCVLALAAFVTRTKKGR